MAKPKPSKPPRIKRGHKKPSYKPNADEVDRRIAAVELLLSRGARKHEIHDAMAKQFGIHSRTADEYSARARERLIKRLQKPKQDHCADALAFYESMMRSPESKAADKIRARERIDELLGLDAPKRREISGPGGGPVETETIVKVKVSNEVKRRLIRMLDPSIELSEPLQLGNGARTNGEHGGNGQGANGSAEGGAGAELP